MSLELIVLVFIVIWIAAVSAVIFWMVRVFRSLTHGVKKGNLVKILSKVIETERNNSKAISIIEKEILRIDEDLKPKIQKVGLIRFNPFREMGGDHSFSLSLLDGLDNGVIITSLHTRDRTRVYLKQIKKGKCRHDLSSEEKRALTKAQKAK